MNQIKLIINPAFRRPCLTVGNWHWNMCEASSSSSDMHRACLTSTYVLARGLALVGLSYHKAQTVLLGPITELPSPVGITWSGPRAHEQFGGTPMSPNKRKLRPCSQKLAIFFSEGMYRGIPGGGNSYRREFGGRALGEGRPLERT